MLPNRSKKKQHGGLETPSTKDAAYGHLKAGAMSAGHTGISHKPSTFYKGHKTALTMYTGERDSHSKSHPNGSIAMPNKKTWRSPTFVPGVSSQGTTKAPALTLMKDTSPVSPSFPKRSFGEDDGPQQMSAYGSLSPATVFTCNFCGKNFSKAESLATHKKCHKVDRVITLDANVIKEGKIIIDGIDVDIAPIIRLRKLSSSESIPGEVKSEGVRDSPPGGFVFTHKKYGPIKTYGSHPGARGFRDTTAMTIGKKTLGESEKVSPLPGELTLSKLRQEFHAAAEECHDNPTSSRPQSDSHITIDLAVKRAGMTCTYTGKSSKKVNAKAQITDINNDEADKNDSKTSRYGQRITSVDRPTLYPLPTTIMSTIPIKSNRIVSSENKNSNIPPIGILPDVKKGNAKKSSNVDRKDAPGKTKGRQGKLVKESKTPKKGNKKLDGGNVKKIDKKETVGKTSKSTGTTTSEKKLGNVKSKSKEQNVTAEKAHKEPKQKGEVKGPNNKITEDMRQIMKQTNEIDLRDKRKFLPENYEKMKTNAWRYGIMLPSMVPPIGMARYFRHRLENLMIKDRIAKVTFEPWDILSAESSPRGRKKKNEKHSSSKNVEKTSKLTRSNSSTSTSSVSSRKRKRLVSVSSVASDPVSQIGRKPKKITKSKSGSVESRQSTKSTDSLERRRDLSSKSNKTVSSAAQKVKKFNNHKRASKRSRTASTETVKRQHEKHVQDGHRSDSEIITKKAADDPSLLPNINNQEDIVIEHVDDSILIEDEDEEDDESLLKEKLRLRHMINPNMIKCPLCYFEMGDVNLLKDHMKVHAKIPCPLCDLQFQEVTDLQRHLTYHAEQSRDANARESTVLIPVPGEDHDQSDSFASTMVTNSSTADNGAIGVITLDPTGRLGDRHFMDGFLNLPNGADEVSSLRADSTATSDSMHALKSEDAPSTENGSSEVSNILPDIQPQAAEIYHPTNQRLVSEDGILQVSDSQFVAPQPFSTPLATASRNVVLSNLDDDPPVPIIIPDDSGLKRPECRHIRKKKRPSNAHDHSMGSYHACDDCETDFENEQLQQQQQIRPLVILSSMSIQSHHSSAPQDSRQGNVQPIEPAMQYSYPQSMIFDIQPTGATVEEQIVAGSSNPSVEDDESPMYQGIEYVATINLPSHETTPSVDQESEEPRKENPPEQEIASRSGNKTFSVNEVAMMVRAELESSKASSTKENNAQKTQRGKSSVDKEPTEKESSSKSNSVDQTTQPGRTETETVHTEQRQLLEEPQTDKSSGKGTVAKSLVRQPLPEKPEALQGKQPAEKSHLSMQQTNKPDSEKTPTVNTIPEVTDAEKTVQTQTLEQQLRTKQHEEKAKDRPLPTAKPLSKSLSTEKTNQPDKSYAETSGVKNAHGVLRRKMKPHRKLHPEKLHPDKSTLDKVSYNRSAHEKSHTGKSTPVEASSEKPPVQHIYPTRNPHIDHSILNTAHDKAKPRNVVSAPSTDNESVTGNGAIKVKKTVPASVTTTAVNKSVNKAATEEKDAIEVTPRMITRARNSTVAKLKQPTVPERRPLPRNDSKSTENTTAGTAKQGEHAKTDNNERTQRTISNIVKEQGSAKRKAKTVFRSPTTLDPEPISIDNGNKIIASKKELEVKQKSRQTTATTAMEDVNAKEDNGKNVGNKGRITRQKAGLQNKVTHSLTATISGKKADASEVSPTSGSGDLGKAATRKSKIQNEKGTGNQKAKPTSGKSAANLTITEAESEQQEPTKINKASNVYDYNENDTEQNGEMENFRELRTKRKRKQLNECIVHLPQIRPDTLSTVLSTGSVTVSDDSSIAGSEFSKTTDTRLGDDEHDDENGTEAKESYSEKKIKKKRRRKRKGVQHFMETDKQNGEKNDDKSCTANPVEPIPIYSNPKNGLKGSQGFREIDFPYSKSNLNGNLASYVAGSKEINNNNILPVPGSVVSRPITTAPYSITSSLLSSRTQAQIQSERLFPIDMWNREHQFTSSKTPEIVSRLNSSNSTASGSESDVDPLRYDRGLSGQSSPGNIMLTSAALKIPQPELSYVRAELTVNSTRLNGSSQTALQRNSLPLGSHVAPTFPPRRIQSSVAHSTAAIQAALSTPPSPMRDGKPVWPKTTFAVPGAVKAPEFAISKTSPGESMNISQAVSLKPNISNNQTDPNTLVATEKSGSSEILVSRTTQVAAAVRSSVATTSVRITKQPELLKARPYGEIQPTRPPVLTKPVGTTETPRFPTPTLIQQQIVRQLSKNPPTSQLKIPQASNSQGSIGSQPTTSARPRLQTHEGQPTGTMQAYGAQKQVGTVGQTNVIFNPRMTQSTGLRQIVPTHQVKSGEQPRIAGPRGPSNRPRGPTQQSLPVRTGQQPASARSTQQPRLTGSETSVSSSRAQPRAPGATPVRYVGSTQVQTFSRPTQIQVTAARTFEPRLTGSLTTVSFGAKPRVPGATSTGLSQTQTSRPLQIQELQTRMSGSVSSISSGAQQRVPGASSAQHFRPPQSQMSIRPYQVHATQARPGVFHQIKLPGQTQTMRTNLVVQQPRSTVLVQSPTQAAPTLTRLVGPGLSQPASTSGLAFSSRTITTGSSTLSRSETTVSSSTFPVTCHALAKTTGVTTEQQSAIDNQTSVLLTQTNMGPAELLKYFRIPQQQGSQNRLTYPTTILTNPMPDGRAPPPTIVRLPGPPPNTRQVGPVHIAAVPVQGPTEPTLQEILEALPPLVQSSLEQKLESLPPGPRASFIKIIQQDERIRDQVIRSQIANRQIEMALGQSEEARRLLLLAGGFQPTEGTRPNLTPVRPPSAYSTVTQPRPAGSPAVITAVPIRHGQPILRTQNPPSHQPVPELSTASQVATYDSLTNQRIKSIYDNISEISHEEMPNHPETENRKRPAAELEASEEETRPPKNPRSTDTFKSTTSTKTPKFKCRECNKNFNHKFMIKDHIHASHPTVDVDSCIIRIAASSTKDSSTYSEPDAAISVSESSHGEQDQESTNERQQDVIDLTKQNPPQEQAIESKPSQTYDEQRGSDKNRIRNILRQMKPSDLIELANDIKMNLEGNSPESSTVPSLTARSNDSALATPGANVSGSSPDKSAHSGFSSRAAGCQLEKNFPSGSTSQPIAESVMATKPKNPHGFDTDRCALSNAQPSKSSDVTTIYAQKAEIESATVNSAGNQIPPLRSQQKKIGLERHMLLGPILQGPMDVQLPGSMGSCQPLPQNQPKKKNSDQQQKHQMGKEEPGRQVQQRTEQHSSWHPQNNTNNVQDKPIAVSSQMRPMVGRPGNQHRIIGSDRKWLIDVLNDAPVDPPPKQPRQQQLQQHKQQSTSNKEVQDRSGERQSASASVTKPREQQQRPGGPRGPYVVMRCELDMSQYQRRLNEIITMTKPSKHGWTVEEFQDKFADYLGAPESEYKEITEILLNKKILGKKFSSIDDFKQIVSDDLEARNIQIEPPSLTQEQIEKQEAVFRKATLQEKDTIPSPALKEVVHQDTAYLTNDQLREAQKLGLEAIKEGVESKKEVSSHTVIDDGETISEKKTDSLTCQNIGKQIPAVNKKQVSEENNAILIQERTTEETLEKSGKSDAVFLPEKQLQHFNTTQECIPKRTLEEVQKAVAVFRPEKHLQRNTTEEDMSKQTQKRPTAFTGRPGNPNKLIGLGRKKLIGVIRDALVDPLQPTPQKTDVTLMEEPIREETLKSNAVFVPEKQLHLNIRQEHNPKQTLGEVQKADTILMQECISKQTLEKVQKADTILMQECIPKQTLEKVKKADAFFLLEKQLQRITAKEHISKQTLVKVQADNVAFLTEKQLQSNTTEEQNQKRKTAFTGRPGDPYKQIGLDRKKLIGVIRDALVDPLQPTPQKAGVTLMEEPIPEQTLEEVLQSGSIRQKHTQEQIENKDVEERKMNLPVIKPRVEDDKTRELEIPKPLPQQLQSRTPPREALLRIQEHSSSTSTSVTTSWSKSETVTSVLKGSPTSDFHHPHGGLCTLVHPPGESCPANMQRKYQELKGIWKTRETGYQCDICGELFDALWKREAHKEKIHGIKMPILPKGVATSGTEDKTKGLEEQASMNSVPKSHATAPDNVESADTASNKTREITEREYDCAKHRSQVDSETSSAVADHSKIPVSVIELLDKDQPVPSENINKEKPFPVPEKDGIRGAMLGESSSTAKPSGLPYSAVSDSATSTAPLSFTPSLTLPLSVGSNSTSPLEMLASFASSQTNPGQVTGTGVQLALPPTVYSAVQLGNQLTNPTVISITPPVARREQAIQTVANAAIRNITGDGITLQPYTVQGPTVMTSAQHCAPIQSTTPLRQVQNVSPSTASVLSPETQNVAQGDPDVECIGSVETRPSGLKLLVPEVQPRDKSKTVKDLLRLSKRQNTEGKNNPAAAAGNVFDDSVDNMMTEVRKRGRPRGTTVNKASAELALCKICGKEKTTVRGQPHKCLVHSCIWCDTSFDTAQQLMDHVKNTHPQKSVYECRVCGKGFNVKGTLERHMFVHSKKKEYKCNICKLAFTQSNNLKRHIAIHTGQKAFKCGECDKAFTSKYNLSQHLLVHFPKRQTYSCRFCKKSFLFARTRDKHEFTHFGFTELQCSKCLKKFPSLPSLEAHIDIYHGGVGEGEACFYECDTKTLKSSDPSMTSNKKQRKHICPICNQNFFFLLHLQEHMRSHKVPDSDLYACTKCDARFPSSEAVRAHIDTHSPLHCSECDETFTFDTQKAAHKLTHHFNGDGAQGKD